MKKIIFLLLILISGSMATQEKNCICSNPENTKQIISLSQFIEKIKIKNNSIKSFENINIIVDDVFIEKVSEYNIEENCVKQLKILPVPPEDINREGATPTIIIITKRKK